MHSGELCNYQGNVLHLSLRDLQVGEAIAFTLLLEVRHNLLCRHWLLLNGRPLWRSSLVSTMVITMPKIVWQSSNCAKRSPAASRIHVILSSIVPPATLLPGASSLVMTFGAMLSASRAAKVSNRLPELPMKIGGCGLCTGILERQSQLLVIGLPDARANT